jgi:hypothetical protein
MPKIAIDEHRQSCATKYEVGPAKQSAATTPPRDLEAPQCADQPNFSRPIAPVPNPRHDRRPLGWREHVSHTTGSRLSAASQSHAAHLLFQYRCNLRLRKAVKKGYATIEIELLGKVADESAAAASAVHQPWVLHQEV